MSLRLVQELGFSYQEAVNSQEIRLIQTYLKYSLEKLAAELTDKDIFVKTLSLASWEHFISLPVPLQTKISSRLVSYCEVVAEIIEKEIDLNNNKDILRYFLFKRGLSLSEEFYMTLEDADVVEIYDLEFTQVFRNFKVLELTDYDLLEIETRPWMELFGRHESVTAQLVEASIKILKPTPGVHKLKVDSHIMQELLTKKRKLFQIQHRFAAPIYYHENCVGLICTQSADLVAPESKAFDFIRK